MKTILLLLVMALGAAPATDGIKVVNPSVSRQGKKVAVSMDMDMKEAKVPSNKAVLLTPVLKSGINEVELPAVGLYSRGRFWQYERMGTRMSGPSETSFRSSRIPETYHYVTQLPWQDWMSNCTLELREREYGCCDQNRPLGSSVLYSYDAANDLSQEVKTVVRVDTVYVDREVYIEREVVVEKDPGMIRSVEGRAFLDYALGQTAVDPDYHSNAAELGKMLTTIESVMQNPDWKINKIWIKGYASPEGPYANNARLAKGRTEAIKKYISDKYHVPESVFELESEAENWEGLRYFVEESSLPHRAEILEIMDGDRTPDDKEWMIKSRYPEDFKVLQDQCLPYLRRTDYRIEYNIIQH